MWARVPALQQKSSGACRHDGGPFDYSDEEPDLPTPFTELEVVMKLFEFSPTRSIRVRWTLQELEIDFDAVTVNLLAGEHRQPAFLKINPAGKIPALVDGDMVLTESVAIALYLADKYPDKKLVPADLEQRAQLNRWLLFTTTLTDVRASDCICLFQ
jgi:Glutathione S-transferase, N-terminal domain